MTKTNFEEILNELKQDERIQKEIDKHNLSIEQQIEAIPVFYEIKNRPKESKVQIGLEITELGTIEKTVTHPVGFSDQNQNNSSWLNKYKNQKEELSNLTFLKGKVKFLSIFNLPNNEFGKRVTFIVETKSNFSKKKNFIPVVLFDHKEVFYKDIDNEKEVTFTGTINITTYIGQTDGIKRRGFEIIANPQEFLIEKEKKREAEIIR